MVILLGCSTFVSIVTWPSLIATQQKSRMLALIKRLFRLTRSCSGPTDALVMASTAEHQPMRSEINKPVRPEINKPVRSDK